MPVEGIVGMEETRIHFPPRSLQRASHCLDHFSLFSSNSNLLLLCLPQRSPSSSSFADILSAVLSGYFLGL